MSTPIRPDAGTTRNQTMRDYWNENAVKLQAELAAAGVESSAADDVIATNAGGWFAAMGENEKASVIATLRNLAPA
jgi:hypothetical protein